MHLLFFQKNTLIFERFVCEPNRESKLFSYFKCEIKQVSRRYLRYNIEGNLTRPLRSVHVHTVAYYRYNTYVKWAIDLWEDVCGWLSGTKHSYFMDWTLKRLLNYSNINHPCPLQGNMFIKVDNISVDKFQMQQFIPSGRYRWDVNLTETYKGNVIFMAKLFMAVSDHRVEKF